MKTSHLAIIVLVTFIVGFVFGMSVQRKYRPCTEVQIVTVHDTVTTTDTIRRDVPGPVETRIIRADTVRIKISPVGNDSTRVDTMTPPKQNDSNAGVKIGQSGEVIIPIKQETYITPEYKAVVEGWRPKLVSMEVYQKTQTITNTVTKTVLKSPKWALTIGPGASWDGKQIAPSINAGIGFVIWSK